MRTAIIAALSLLVLICGLTEARRPMVGAATDVRGPDATIQDVVAAATPAILTAGRAIGVSSHSRLSVVEYRSQVVAGTNFFVKIRAEHSPTEFIACRLFRPLPPNHKEIEVVKCKPIDEETNVQYF